MLKLSLPTIGTVTSRFGFRWKPKKGFHSGLDIANKIGTPIKACYDGIVQFAGTRGNYGTAIIIFHARLGSVWSLYGHLSAMGVSVGDFIKQGQEIGKMGSTGYSTGSHLHFEVRVGTNGIAFAKNPEKFLAIGEQQCPEN